MFTFTYVVYFDQLTHAYACVPMVENDQKLSRFSSRASCEPLMCMMKVFQVFSIVFDHANTCASKHSLVEIHNILMLLNRFNLHKFYILRKTKQKIY